jgi:MEMO1 family protein
VGPMPHGSGQTTPSTRPPVVAGMFYPADPDRCAAAAGQLLNAADVSRAIDRVWRGGIVPHAGWICSGAVAGEALRAIYESRGRRMPDVVVVFGAVHTPAPLATAALDSHERWAVPGSVSDVRRELSAKLSADAPRMFVTDDRFHEREHAVEVELPLIQRLWPGVTVLPVEVPLIDDAVAIGVATAKALESQGLSDAVYLASSDLTHYGPNYGFAPAGVGVAGLAWALDNDRKLLDAVTAMAAERIVPEVRARLNACGGGAIAAMLAACRERGIVEGRVLRHTNSHQTLATVAPQRPDNAVGYAAVVVG